MNPLATSEWHLVSLAPWGSAGTTLAIVASVAVLALAWRALLRERLSRQLVLLVLRAGAVAAALVLFFQPAVRREDVTRVPNHVAVLVDQSESMRLAERPGEPTRAARAARWLAREKDTFAKLRAEHRVDFFTFGDKLVPTTEEALVRGPQAPLEGATRLREALAQLRTHYEGRELAGAIVVSDGIDNGRLGQGVGAGLDADTHDFLKSLDAPVHGAWTGATGLHDIAITRVLADDFAFVRTAVQIEAVLRVVGADEAGWRGRTLLVTLREGGIPVRTMPVALEHGKTDYHVAFAFTPERVGKYVYEISTPFLAGEAIAENNSRTFLLKVIRDKIRVLQVAGRPSWDERFLRGLLKHDPNVDLISFFILRTPTDIESVPSEELSLIPFPTEELFQEQLRSFDVVFIQNFNYGPYGIGAYLGEIRRYVDEGGGLAMLGGDLAFTTGGWSRTPVADVLPVELHDDTMPRERLIDAQPFKLSLTPEGRTHPVTALRVDLAENAARWAALPDLEGTNVVSRARPGATVLGIHPSKRGGDGKPLPILSVTEAGKGRVLAFTSDSSWRWGFGRGGGAVEDGRHYQRFWENAIRWLIRDPSLSFLRIEIPQTEYARGQRVGIDVRALGPDYRPLPNTDVTVTVTRITSEPGVRDAAAREAAARAEAAGRGTSSPSAQGGSPVVAHRGRTDEDGELHVELEPLAPGGYRAVARATLGGPGGGRAVEERDVFVVRGAGPELEEPEARADILRLVAEATGGSFRGPDSSLAGLRFHPPRVIRMNRHQDVELWSRWWVLLAAAGCLSANWALRRRWGYA